MRTDAAFGRDLSFGINTSEKSEGTFSYQLDRSEAIPGVGAMPKGPHDRVFAIFSSTIDRSRAPTPRAEPPRRDKHFFSPTPPLNLKDRVTNDVATVAAVLSK